jgi:hypothetical protein
VVFEGAEVLTSLPLIEQAKESIQFIDIENRTLANSARMPHPRSQNHPKFSLRPPKQSSRSAKRGAPGATHGEESPTFLRHSKPRSSRNSAATKGNVMAQFNRMEWESRRLTRGRTSRTCSTNRTTRSTHSRSRRHAGRRAMTKQAKANIV